MMQTVHPTRSVLMIGTDINGKGGIASVLAMYRDAGFLNDRIYLPSTCDGSLPVRILFFIRFLVKLIWILSTQPSIQIVHLHSASRGSFARKSLVLLLAQCFGKKTIMHIHGAGFKDFYQQSPPPAKRWITRMLDTSDAVIALSKSWQQDLQQITHHPNIHVIYNPTCVKTPSYHDSPEVTFLFMGRLGERKGVYDIIEAARHLQNRKARIHLYGDGPVEQIRRQVESAGVEKTVSVHGWIEGKQKDNVFQSADVLILPSYNEGLPISVLEALAYGLPIIATPVGGIPEAVIHGSNGYLIAPGDALALADYIDLLAASFTRRKIMGEASYRLACEKFEINVIIRRLESLYEHLLNAPASNLQPVG